MHAALCSLFFLHQSSFLEQLYECKQINFWPLPFRNSGGTETVSDCLISLWRENVQRRLCSEAAKFNRLRQISSVIIYLFILFSPPGTSVSAPKTKQSSTDLYWCQNGSEIRRSFSFSLMQNSLCVHSDPLWFSSQTHKEALTHTTPGAVTHSRSRRQLCSLTSLWLLAVWRVEPNNFDWQVQFYTRIKLSFMASAQPLFWIVRVYSFENEVCRMKHRQVFAGSSKQQHNITSVLRRLEKKDTFWPQSSNSFMDFGLHERLNVFNSGILTICHNPRRGAETAAVL